MDSTEFMRLVDTISRERGLDKEIIIADIESALIQAANKRFDAMGDFTLTIDRESGEIRAFEDSQPIALESLGRIVANVAKQVIMQKLRRANATFSTMSLNTALTPSLWSILRTSAVVIVSLGRTEAILPREEQIPGEIYRPGNTIRCYSTCKRKVSAFADPFSYPPTSCANSSSPKSLKSVTT